MSSGEPFEDFGDWIERQRQYRPWLLELPNLELIDLWQKEAREADALQMALFSVDQFERPGQGDS